MRKHKKEPTVSTAIGLNIGHAYVKATLLSPAGADHTTVFPSLLAPAGQTAAGSLRDISQVSYGGSIYWVGEDALLASATPTTLLTQDRLTHATFLPVLVIEALNRLALWEQPGVCVTGLPATWMLKERAEALGARLREATQGKDVFQRIQVVPEPLGLLFSAMLDAQGQPTNLYNAQHVGFLDLGHHTVDGGVAVRQKVANESLFTFNLGSSKPLGQLRGLLTAAFDREFTLFETDEAVRRGGVFVRGKLLDLPTGWQTIFQRNAEAIVTRLQEQWGNGGHLDAILIGGGGAEQPVVTDMLTNAYPHALIVHEPQLAIARGYARLALRLMAIAS